jgi:hypothetical protein
MGFAADNHGPLWAITCYFNPVGYQRRRQNYYRFRRALNAPLLTVELSFQDHYELDDTAAEIVIRLRGGDVLWQKERLLNVALTHLPKGCETVAWLDCDVLLPADGWANDAERLLVRFPLVQLFSNLAHLGPDEISADAPRLPASAWRTSLAYRWTTRTVAPGIFARAEGTGQARCNCGMAWAGRRALLERHGFYDAMILGMGDRMFAAAALGRFADAAVGHHLNAAQTAHYLRWARPFHDEVKGRVGYCAGTAFHLWHGDLADRAYCERYDGFAAFDFDPHRDLAIAPTGCWRWSTPKHAMHRHVADYFPRRREDGAPESPRPTGRPPGAWMPGLSA